MSEAARIRIGRLDSKERLRAEGERLYRRAHRAAGAHPTPGDAVQLARVLETVASLVHEDRAA